MVSYQVVALIVLGTLISFGGLVGAIVFAFRMARGPSLGAAGPLNPTQAASVPSGVEATVLQGLSERLAIIEGSITALRVAIEQYAALSNRLADLEGRLPSLLGQYEKMTQVTLNADKRASERERRANKKDAEEGEMTVAEAALQMGLATSAGQESEPPEAGNPAAGVLGNGGHGSRR